MSSSSSDSDSNSSDSNSEQLFLSFRLNGVDNASPFPLVDNQVPDANCSVEAPFQCGWWHEPVPGPTCVAFYQQRCSNETLGSVDLGVLGPWRQDPGRWPVQRGSWQLSIATLLLLRQERAWIAPAFWLPTSATTPLPWTPDLDRDVGTPKDNYCSEDPKKAGVFRRLWSAGEVSVDCNNLSVVLPGAKADDEEADRTTVTVDRTTVTCTFTDDKKVQCTSALERSPAPVRKCVSVRARPC